MYLKETKVAKHRAHVVGSLKHDCIYFGRMKKIPQAIMGQVQPKMVQVNKQIVAVIYGTITSTRLHEIY